MIDTTSINSNNTRCTIFLVILVSYNSITCIFNIKFSNRIFKTFM